VRTGFSLVELLVAMSIVVIAIGITFGSTRLDTREQAVRAAAEELAAVCRKARARAMAEHQAVGLSFNIQNAPGSSGRVLNNRSGGHWYRLLGAGSTVGSEHRIFGTPPLLVRWYSTRDGAKIQELGKYDNPIRYFLESVERSWIGPPTMLPAHRVRFLALADQDNGDFVQPGDTYAPTYPRPWFGWWDQSSKRLYPWGGYDPAIPLTDQTGTTDSVLYQPRTLGGRTISPSGFYYEGYDGAIPDSRHPSDRLVVDDTNNDGKIQYDTANPGTNDDTSAARRYALWRAGEPRPLVEARFTDCLVLFLPDGTVTAAWMGLRHQYCCNINNGNYNGGKLFSDPSTTTVATTAPAGKFLLRDLAPADRCNRASDSLYTSTSAEYATEATWLARRSGAYWITLAPDVADDNDAFADAASALRSITPCYRVGIGLLGDVQVVRVRTSPPPEDPAWVLDTVLHAGTWGSAAVTSVHYQRNQRTLADGTPTGRPVHDTVTPEMLRDRVWWRQ